MIDRQVEEAASFLRSRGFDGRFDCAMVLGTRPGKLADDIKDAVSLAYDAPMAPFAKVLTLST